MRHRKSLVWPVALIPVMAGVALLLDSTLNDDGVAIDHPSHETIHSHGFNLPPARRYWIRFDDGGAAVVPIVHHRRIAPV